MSKNICFISIFDLTAVQYEQAIRLQARGHRCYWMSTNPKWTHWLLSKCVAQENILELVFEESDFFDDEVKHGVILEIAEAEGAGSLTANMAMIADRFIMAENKADINDYACLYYHHIKRFLVNKAIDVVFGEPTNMNEMMTSLVCDHLGIPFLYPQNMRIPSYRFFFESGIATGIMISSGNGAADGTGEVILEEFRAKSTHPSYFYLHNRKTLNIKKNLWSLINRLRGLFATKRTLTHHLFLDRLIVRFQSFFNGLYLTRFYQYDLLEKISGKIAFFGLHVQPEASIDVTGPYFSNQLKLIQDMRRALPFDTTLVVKEHPNFLGQKPIHFFRELKRLPNVQVIHPRTSTFDIYKRANLVLTVSGTTAYEAGMLGIPAITFARMFFMGFSSVHYCPDVTQLKPLAMRLLNEPQVDHAADVAFVNWLIRHSYAGYWTDPLTDPSVMSASNLEALFVGFLDVVEGVLSKESAQGAADAA